MSQTTIDPAEIAKFEAMAAEWWDVNGKFKPLHMLNPCRLDYITSARSRRNSIVILRNSNLSRGCAFWISAAVAAC
jgi:2-polyprenyl-3-methyl-5-hydroxy-6-metoxy-1,4-benzoquinol methylase